jgi:hypothetical protein
MTELHVQRKRNSFLWLWALLILLVIGAGIYLYLHYKNPKEYPVSLKSTSSMQQEKISTAKTF